VWRRLEAYADQGVGAPARFRGRAPPSALVRRGSYGVATGCSFPMSGLGTGRLSYQKQLASRDATCTISDARSTKSPPSCYWPQTGTGGSRRPRRRRL